MLKEKMLDPLSVVKSEPLPEKTVREKLAKTVREARELKIPTIVIFEGWGASGKGYMIEKLISELDPRGFKVWSVGTASADERRYPMLKRFWEKLPSNGKISVFDRSWYREVSISRVEEKLGVKTVERSFRDILEFEQQLADDGCNIVKIFLHISKKEQTQRFDALEASKATSWRVTDVDRRRHKKYGEYYDAFSEMIERTDREYAPWYVLDAEDRKTTAAAVCRIVLQSLEKAIEAKNSRAPGLDRKDDAIDKALAKETHECPIPNEVRTDTGIAPLPIKPLDSYDLTLDIPDDIYKEKLKALQKELFELHNRLYTKKIPLVIVFEGWDAAGKGGAIKRLTSGLDPRGFEVVPISAPTPTELSYQYMRRFWTALPRTGHIGIFDRSWYGRVMVERLEGFAKFSEWTRAYDEINKFERTLTDSGAIVIKFWLQIDSDEQLRRFNERMNDPDKQWKITDEDWRNREKMTEYHIAVDQMLKLTNTSFAPWQVVEANSKKYARIKVLQTVVDTLRERL